MADINDINAALSVKIVGSDATGVEQTPVSSTSSGSLKVAIPDRPSELRNRISVNINIPDTTLVPAGTVIYTVTPGRTLYIQSFLVTQLNIAASDGSWSLNDNTIVKCTFLVPARVGGSTPGAAFISSPTMPEPMQFTTNVRLVEITGDLRVAGYLIGYEE